MRLPQYLVCTVVITGLIAVALAGCSSSNGPTDDSQPAATTKPRLLADDAYVHADSLASNPQERAAVAAARRAEGQAVSPRNKPKTVLVMRQVLLESSTPEIRATVAAGLANSMDFASTPFLLDAMEDESPLVGEAAARAIERMFDWSPDFQADDTIEKKQEVVAKYRERWIKLEDSDLYAVYTNPAKKEQARRLAEKKALAERRRERDPRRRNKAENEIDGPAAGVVPPPRTVRPRAPATQ